MVLVVKDYHGGFEMPMAVHVVPVRLRPAVVQNVQAVQRPSVGSDSEHGHVHELPKHGVAVKLKVRAPKKDAEAGRLYSQLYTLTKVLERMEELLDGYRSLAEAEQPVKGAMVIEVVDQKKHGFLHQVQRLFGVGNVELVLGLVKHIHFQLSPLSEGRLEPSLCKGLVPLPPAQMRRVYKGKLKEFRVGLAEGAQLPL